MGVSFYSASKYLFPLFKNFFLASILEVVTVSVNNISFNPGVSNLVIKKGITPGTGNSAGSKDTTIEVQSYFSFGGTVDIANVARGSL